MFQLGYNTNGFICHSLDSTLEIISTLGYKCAAITIDHHVLNPWDAAIENHLAHTKKLLDQFSLSCVVETGARFLLNPRIKHEPTLISTDSDGRKLRLKFLKKAIDFAVILESKAVSFWSGIKPDHVDDKTAWHWLVSGCNELSTYAENHGVSLAFEPEPGMMISTLSEYQKLKEEVSTDFFGLTLDLGHAFLTEDISVGDCIRKYRYLIKNIHIEDMKKELHEHLFFGEGDMDFSEIFAALKATEYDGPINVELSRHSHNAVEVAQKTKTFLLQVIDNQ